MAGNLLDWQTVEVGCLHRGSLSPVKETVCADSLKLRSRSFVYRGSGLQTLFQIRVLQVPGTELYKDGTCIYLVSCP
jgi:hypothetical protein